MWFAMALSSKNEKPTTRSAWSSIVRIRKRRPRGLKQVPQKLVVDIVVVLHFGRFHECAELARAAIGGGAFQIGIALLDVLAEDLRRPGGLIELFDRLVNVVRQVAFCLAQVLDL